MSEQQVNSVYRVTEDAVHGFFKEHRFLSNFHPCRIVYGGLIYTSTEAAYQAAKCENPGQIPLFTTLTPSESKKRGRTIELREGWEEIKDTVMLDVNLIKYRTHPDLLQMLLDTGDRLLEETNWWGDTYWGVCRGIGDNRLGKILMHIRDYQK